MLRGWSQIDLAERSRLKQPDISKYELGKMFPSPKVIARLAQAFDVTAPEFYGWMLPTGKQDAA